MCNIVDKGKTYVNNGFIRGDNLYIYIMSSGKEYNIHTSHFLHDVIWLISFDISTEWHALQWCF